MSSFGLGTKGTRLYATLRFLFQPIEGKWCHVVTEIWVNIGSNNGLLPDSTKPLPEPMLPYHQIGIHLRTISCFSLRTIQWVHRTIQWVHRTHGQMKWGSIWFWWGFKTQKLPLDGTLKVSNIRCTKFQYLSDSHPALQLPLSNLLKPCIKSRMKM